MQCAPGIFMGSVQTTNLQRQAKHGGDTAKTWTIDTIRAFLNAMANAIRDFLDVISSSALTYLPDEFSKAIKRRMADPFTIVVSVTGIGVCTED